MDHSQVIEKAKAAKEYVTQTYPYYKVYRECQTRAFSKGSATLIAAGAGVYILQEIFRKKLPYERTAFMMMPILLGTVAAYAVTRHETKVCQHMWMALEEKHSVITPASERKELAQEAENETIMVN
ncbi:transmembrane protein 141-like [Gigantopelta aegis]|uniref:transmembrane protein 141-like n=1 Tax=Gigantopelta aegis TaxID=1735272 RepID=UPI001B888570|nr:transmembrane protein 141-like [Gigantopelta aegis]